MLGKLDWEKVKIEYITENTSYRKLAAKYKIPTATIFQRAKQEEWVQEKERYLCKTTAKVLESIETEQVKRAIRLQKVADKLLDKVEASVDDFEMRELFEDRKALRQITGALKDIKEVQMIRSDGDIEEQRARIKNLQKQAETGSEDKSVRVVLDPIPEEWKK